MDSVRAMALSWPPSLAQVLSSLFVLILYVFARMIHHGYFDALSAYPGPKLWAMSDFPRARYMLKGELHNKLCELHAQYGSVVRIGRNFLSYTDPDAWNDIYAKIRPQLVKDDSAGPPPPSGVFGLAFTPSDTDHSRMRRNLSHGFSEKALKEQEPILTGYVDTFIEKLQKNALKGPVDLSLFLNLVTVDITGDLTFGQSFGCLESETLHVWVANMFKFVQQFVLIGVSQMFPPMNAVVLWIGNTFFGKAQASHREFVADAVAKRINRSTDRPDFMGYIQKNFDTQHGMSMLELHETCVGIIIAGSETTASSLSGTIYYLLKNPETLQRLVKEIRTEFSNEEEINIASTQKLEYEHAVIEESLRIFPPVSVQSQRVTGPNGHTIAGRFVPGKTQVSFAHTAAYRAPENFCDPEKFLPERWMGDERYSTDRKKVLQPFSYGPRNCIGLHLAYAEMELILTRLLWNFDIELCEESKDWVEGMKVFMLYQREPLMVKLTRVVRA